jgi:hypothetical protein
VALSVLIEPAIEARIEEEAHRLGISKSDFVKDATERVLGLKSPAELLHQVRSNTPLGTSDASEQVSGDALVPRVSLISNHAEFGTYGTDLA